MSRDTLFARVAHSYGTSALHAIFSSTAHAGSRMTPVAPSTPHVLQRLVSLSTKGIALSSLNESEQRALADIERLGLKLDRVRRSGFICLAGTVIVADQRTFAREVA